MSYINSQWWDQSTSQIRGSTQILITRWPLILLNNVFHVSLAAQKNFELSQQLFTITALFLKHPPSPKTSLLYRDSRRTASPQWSMFPEPVVHCITNPTSPEGPESPVHTRACRLTHTMEMTLIALFIGPAPVQLWRSIAHTKVWGASRVGQ